MSLTEHQLQRLNDELHDRIRALEAEVAKAKQNHFDAMAREVSRSIDDHAKWSAAYVEERERNTDLAFERDALAAQNARLREALAECAEWLESRPDYTEGDAATSSMARGLLAETPGAERVTEEQ